MVHFSTGLDSGFAVRLARARSQDVGQLAVSVIWTSSRTRPSSIRNTCAAADFAQQEWPPEIQQRLNDAQRRIAAAFDRLGRRVRVPGRERIAFALADIPLALVRRHLKAGEAIPIGAEDLVATTTCALLAAET